jgi:hypothetical protein
MSKCSTGKTLFSLLLIFKLQSSAPFLSPSLLYFGKSQVSAAFCVQGDCVGGNMEGRNLNVSDTPSTEPRLVVPPERSGYRQQAPQERLGALKVSTNTQNGGVQIYRFQYAEMTQPSEQRSISMVTFVSFVIKLI